MSKSPRCKKAANRRAITSPPISPSKVLEAQLLLAKVDAAKSNKKQRKKSKAEPAKATNKCKKDDVEADDLELEMRGGEDNRGKKKARNTSIQWSKPHMHHLSDKLLGIIEDNATLKVAFEFEKGTSESVPTGGKTCAAHCADIARKLFSDEEGPWEEMDAPVLATIVKNRISVLKMLYIDCQQTMTATGMGLVEEDRTSEIVPGTELGNIWDKICKRCPWYKRLHDLLGTSPVVERAAISHSLSNVDTSCLMRSTALKTPTSLGAKEECEEPDFREGSIEWDLSGLVDTDNPNPASDDSHLGSPGFDNPLADPSPWDSVPPVVKTDSKDAPVGLPPLSALAKDSRLRSASAAPGNSINKHKNALEKAIDITTANREAQVGLAERLAERNARARLDQEHIKATHNLAVEKLRIQAEWDKVKAQQAHELEMLRLQLGMAHPEGMPSYLASSSSSQFHISHFSSPFIQSLEVAQDVLDGTHLGTSSNEFTFLADYNGDAGHLM
ncbi:hypothetical protein K439DRAFT_1610330 [Ramaria rubella]|nr:hypothetical protein K439DRAFT_1610330 [Ramaria rubella]